MMAAGIEHRRLLVLELVLMLVLGLVVLGLCGSATGRRGWGVSLWLRVVLSSIAVVAARCQSSGARISARKNHGRGLQPSRGPASQDRRSLPHIHSPLVRRHCLVSQQLPARSREHDQLNPTPPIASIASVPRSQLCPCRPFPPLLLAIQQRVRGSTIPFPMLNPMFRSNRNHHITTRAHMSQYQMNG